MSNPPGYWHIQVDCSDLELIYDSFCGPTKDGNKSFQTVRPVVGLAYGINVY